MVDQKRLYVEGPDDQHVIYSLMEYHQLARQFTVEPKAGIQNLLAAFRVQLKAQDEDVPIARLGIVVDADTDLQARWASIKHVLTASGYSEVPSTPASAGTIIHQVGRPIIGIWLMPNNYQNGILEDFIHFLVPSDDTLWPRAEACLNQIPHTERLFTEERRSKALLHTWLAWQSEPGKPLGQSITARYLDANASHAQQFITWLRRLFEL